MMFSKFKVLLFIFCGLILLSPAVVHGDEGEVRGVVQRVFEQLKSRDYGSVYDSLPSLSRARMSKSRFVGALSRAQNMYELDRMDVGRVRMSGNMAVVDTVLYGKVLFPLQTEGKIVVQQYLIREEGAWKVATGDNATIKRFLAGNPAFGRKFPIRQPQIYVKQNGNWVEFRPPQLPRR